MRRNEWKCAVLISLLVVSIADVVQSQSLLVFDESFPAQGSQITAECQPAEAVLPTQASRLEFLIDKSVAYSVTWDCVGGSEVSTDVRMNGRMSYSGGDDRLLFTWSNVQKSDEQAKYSCRVQRCSDSVSFYSLDAQITVIIPPEYLNIQPNGTVETYENALATWTIKCNGFVGYPEATLQLIQTVPNQQAVTVTSDVSINANGYGSSTATFSQVLSRWQDGSQFYCWTVNKLNSDVLMYSSPLNVQVQYAPNSTEVFSLDSLLSVTQVSQQQFVVNASDGLTGFVDCMAAGNPQVYVTLAYSGPSDALQLQDGFDFARITINRFFSNEPAVVTCRWNYTSSQFPAKNQRDSVQIQVAFSEPRPRVTTAGSPIVDSFQVLWIIVGVVLAVVLLLASAIVIWCIKIRQSLEPLDQMKLQSGNGNRGNVVQTRADAVYISNAALTSERPQSSSSSSSSSRRAAAQYSSSHS